MTTLAVTEPLIKTDDTLQIRNNYYAVDYQYGKRGVSVDGTRFVLEPLIVELPEVFRGPRPEVLTPEQNSLLSLAAQLYIKADGDASLSVSIGKNLGAKLPADLHSLLEQICSGNTSAEAASKTYIEWAIEQATQPEEPADWLGRK